MNVDTPKRSFDPVYANEPLLSDDIEEIRIHYQLNCRGKGQSNIIVIIIFSAGCPTVSSESSYNFS